MENQKQLNLSIKDQKKFGINNTFQFLKTCQTILEKSIVRCARDKSISPEEKLNELEELNTFQDIISHFQRESS